MYVASLELSETLFELTGWDNPDELNSYGIRVDNEVNPFQCPAYDLGYLLRKLPKFIEPEKNKPHLLTVQPNPIGKGWNALYRLSVKTPTTDIRHATHIQEADTPEDAACKLAIELIKQGVIKP